MSYINTTTAFINKITSEDYDVVRNTIEVLRARGYLIDEIDNNYYLSDNSNENDTETLNDFLTTNNIGIISGNYIEIHNYENISILEKLFNNVYIGLEEEHNYAHYSWDMSFRRQYGQKVPINVLEPYIARYVKAVSSVGIMTYACCDGCHHNKDTKKLYVKHQGIYDSYWHYIILKYYFSNISANINWKIHGNKFSCNYSEKNADEVYYQINKLAKAIYDNRIELRKMKMSIYNNLKFDINHNKYSDEVIFSKILMVFEELKDDTNVKI